MKITLLKWFVFRATFKNYQTLRDVTVLFHCRRDDDGTRMFLPCTVSDQSIHLPFDVYTGWTKGCCCEYIWTLPATSSPAVWRLCGIAHALLTEKFKRNGGDGFPSIFRTGIRVITTTHDGGDVSHFQNTDGEHDYTPRVETITVRFPDTKYLPTSSDVLVKAVAGEKVLSPARALVKCLGEYQPKTTRIEGPKSEQTSWGFGLFADVDVLRIRGDAVCDGPCAAFYKFRTDLKWEFATYDIGSGRFANAPCFVLTETTDNLATLIRSSNALYGFHGEDPLAHLNFVRGVVSKLQNNNNPTVDAVGDDDDDDDGGVGGCCDKPILTDGLVSVDDMLDPSRYTSATAKQACASGSGLGGITYHSSEFTKLTDVRIYKYDFASYMPTLLTKIDGFPWRDIVSQLIGRRAMDNGLVKRTLVTFCGYVKYVCPEVRRQLIYAARHIMCACIDYVEGLAVGNHVLDVVTDGFTVVLARGSPVPEMRRMSQIAGGIPIKNEGNYTDVISSSLNKRILYNRITDDVCLVGCLLKNDPVGIRVGVEDCARAILRYECLGTGWRQNFSWLRDVQDLCWTSSPPGPSLLLDVCTKHDKDVSPIWAYLNPHPVVRVASLNYKAHKPKVGGTLAFCNTTLQTLVTDHTADRLVLYDPKKVFIPDLYYYANMCLDRDHLGFVTKFYPDAYKVAVAELHKCAANLLLHYRHRLFFTETHCIFENDADILRARLRRRNAPAAASNVP